MYVCLLSHFSRVQLFATPWTAACQAPLFMGFPREEYWRGLPFPPLGDLSNSGIESQSHTSPALACGFFTTTATWGSPFTRSVQFSRSVVSDCLRPLGLQHTRLPCPSPTLRLAQTHVYQVSDAFQPSHPLSSPSSPFNIYQHQGLFQWVSSLHQVAKVLELQLQYQSFQWIFRTDFL